MNKRIKKSALGFKLVILNNKLSNQEINQALIIALCEIEGIKPDKTIKIPIAEPECKA